MVPFYSTYVLLKIVRPPGWWLILFFIPIVNIVIGVMVLLDLAKVFGRSNVFAVFGLIFFGIVGYSMLAFGRDRYVFGDVAPPTV
ncbi:MAG TPA: DUF5684 domain-containing protein [Candidatus Saccharimonadia bacterium]|nr:DUF5684 domain-containing protein [Candidatus Saccharimonadia bacterium]